MATEEILSSTVFVALWISINYFKTPDFFFRLILLVSTPPSTMRFPHFSSMNTNLGESSNFAMSSISIPSSFS